MLTSPLRTRLSRGPSSLILVHTVGGLFHTCAYTDCDAKDVDDSGAQEITVETDRPDDEIRTVFNDPNTFNVKHPLYSSWTLWFDSPSTKGRATGSSEYPNSLYWR
jgi:hypothetical protein